MKSWPSTPSALVSAALARASGALRGALVFLWAAAFADDRVISKWNSRCGIAAYTQSPLGGIDPVRLRVFASKVSEVLQADESFVSRCWIEG